MESNRTPAAFKQAENSFFEEVLALEKHIPALRHILHEKQERLTQKRNSYLAKGELKLVDDIEAELRFTAELICRSYELGEELTEFKRWILTLPR